MNRSAKWEASKITFLTTAFKERENLDELYRRCKNTAMCLKDKGIEEFEIWISDNASNDGSVELLSKMCEEHRDIFALINRTNYGPEASTANLIKTALEYSGGDSIYVLLTSDLQDPPEVAGEMARYMLNNQEVDGVMGIKEKGSRTSFLRIARKVYYKALILSSRLRPAPRGFHGFGCYKEDVIIGALELWENSDLYIRQCLANEITVSKYWGYEQASRKHGQSSYLGGGYWRWAVRSLISGDASTSRIALVLGGIGIAVSMCAGLFVCVNTLAGDSQYAGGIPTAILLIVGGFSFQAVMLGLISRQIESIRMGGFRPRVKAELLGCLAISEE